MTPRKRPPGAIWIDWSGVTAVVRCEHCDLQYGPWLELDDAKVFAREHRATHEGEVLDLSQYAEDRLIPAGRPRLSSECTLPNCEAAFYAKGLCEAHYRAERRRRQAAA